MQEKETIITVWCELKNPSLGITAWHLSTSIVMPMSYHINLHLTAMKMLILFQDSRGTEAVLWNKRYLQNYIL